MFLICGSNIEKMLIQENIKMENYVNVNDNSILDIYSSNKNPCHDKLKRA